MIEVYFAPISTVSIVLISNMMSNLLQRSEDRRAACASDGDEEELLGEEHPDTLANLASTNRNQGRWKEAGI